MKGKWVAFGLLAALLLCNGGCSCARDHTTDNGTPVVTEAPASPAQRPAETTAHTQEPVKTAAPAEATAPADTGNCEHVMEDTVVLPTCTEYGYTEHRCTKCGLLLVDQRTEPTGHTLRLVDEKAATCTEDGRIEYCCEVCGQTLSGTLPATGHHAVTDPEVPATCQQTGLTAGSHCDACGVVLTEQQIVPLADHRYENGKCIWCGKAKPNSGSSGGGNELPEIPG